MGFKSIAGLFLGVLAALGICLFLWGRPEIEQIAQPVHAEDKEEDSITLRDRVEVSVEKLPEELVEKAELPIGPLESREVMDTQWLKTSEDRMTRRLLLRGSDEVTRFIVQEETYSRSHDNDEWGSRFLAYKADAFLIDTDPMNVSEVGLAQFIDEYNLEVESKSRFSDYWLLKTRRVELDWVDMLIAEASSRFPGTVVERDLLHFQSAEPDDYSAPYLWHLNQVKAEDAWEFDTGSDAVVIAVVDTGMQRDHPDLVGNLFVNTSEIAGNGLDDDGNGLVDDVSGWDFYDDDADPDDATGHGTHVSGLAAAQGNNGLGLVGVNWNARIIPLKVGENSGLSTSAINEALRYARTLKDAGANVVATNNSYGSSGTNQSSRSEIRNQQDAGILFVAAAGNDGDDMDTGGSNFPAGYPLDIIISVANSRQDDTISTGSNYGAISVDISAPGTDVFSTYTGSSYQELTGTSMSSPMVAGAVALLKSDEPDLTWQQAKQRILDSADPIPSHEGRTVTGGRLNLAAALEPELAGHEIEIPQVPGEVVYLREAGSILRFDVDALSGADVTVGFVGNTLGASLSGQDGSYEAGFSSAGIFRIRAMATVAGIEKFVEKEVFVGPLLEDVTSGLRHFWDFEGEGNAVNDLAGGGNGTLANATRVDSITGRAASFSGNRSSMSFNTSSQSTITVSAIVTIDDIEVGPYPRILHAPDYNFHVSSVLNSSKPYSDNRTLKFSANRTNGQFGLWYTPPNSITENRWMHVVATYDGNNNANTPRLFIDGKEQLVRTQILPNGTQSLDGGLSYLADNDVGTRDFDGDFDEVRIFDRELSKREIAALAMKYLGARWRDYEIVGEGSFWPGQAAAFSLQNANGQILAEEVDWYVDGNSDDYTIEVSSGGAATIRFFEERNYTVSAQAKDASATEVITHVANVEIDSLDEWLTEFFGLERPEPLGQWSGEGDLDGDGTSNRLEFFLDLDPSDDSSRFVYDLQVVSETEFRYVGAPLKEGLDYGLEISDDLANWVRLEGVSQEMEGDQVTFSFEREERFSFIRLRVSQSSDVSSLP
ncbi:MAG: S8 family serine peptidase [Verrucomicrobiota bacterium]